MKKMTQDEILSHLEKIALPYVKTALEQEYQADLAADLANPKEAKKIQKAVKQILSGLLRAEKPFPKDRRFVRNLIKNDKEIPILPPDEEEINRTSKLIAEVLNAAWMGCLYLTLENKKEIFLDERLLPKKIEEADDEIWKAFEGSFNSLLITFEQVKEIMRQFASEVVLPRGGIEIPGVNILIGITSDNPPAFLARRTKS